MAAESVLVDTNVLVYLTRPTSAHHMAATAALTELEAQGSVLWISAQVLREYLAVVTRPQTSAPALPMPAAIADVREFCQAFRLAVPEAAVFDRLLGLLEQRSGAGRQVHDANIVATMLAQGVRKLLTFNAADFRRFSEEIDILAPG